MKSLGSLVLIQAISLATAGIIVPSSNIIEGPSSKTTLVGPDGSVITSVAQGAKIVTDGHSAVVAAPDTVAVLKESKQPIVLETKLEPVLTVHSPVAPLIASHAVPVHGITAHVVPEVEPLHHVVTGAKTTISEHSQTIAHPGPVINAAPVIGIKHHLEPAQIIAHPVPIVKSIEPIHIEAHAAPVVATKTTLSEYSQAIAHPVPIVKSIEPVPHIVKHIEAPVVATKTTLSQYSQAIGHSVPIVKSIEPVHLVPQIPKLVSPALAVETHHIQPETHYLAVEPHHIVPVIGTKTTVSGHSQSLIEARAVPVISQIAPVVTANVFEQHAIPVVGHRVVPIIGTENSRLW